MTTCRVTNGFPLNNCHPPPMSGASFFDSKTINHILSNLSSTKSLHLMHLLPTDKPMVPNSQKQSQRIPWGSMPEDITFPNSSRRPREMMLLPLILWKGRNRNKSSSQLNRRHLMKLYTLMAHPHTQFLHTAVSMTNMGYPWLAHPSVIYSTTLRRSMKWTTGIQITNTGYPWLALLLILHITVPHST